MEVLDKNLSILKSQSWNQTSKEIVKICEFLAQILEMLGQGKNIQPYLSSIIDNCLITGSARSIRKLSYLILKQAATLYEIPWSLVSSSISQDLGTSSDPEFQVYALRMLSILPLDLSISTFLSHETSISASIQGKSGECLQSAYLSSLPPILIRIWCGHSGENYQLQDAVKELFKYIISLILDPDDRLCSLSFAALSLLFQESEEGKLRGHSQELEANGSDSELLSPLIDYLCRPHMSQLSLVIYRVCAFDFRARVKMIYGLTKLLLWAGDRKEIRRLEQECLVPMLGNLEKGVVWQVAKCLNLMKLDISTTWTICNSLISQSPSEANPTPLLLLVMDGMATLPVSLQLNLALETLKHSNRILSRVDRYSVLLSCLSSIVLLSKILLQSEEQSAVYQLFSQAWFVEMWMSSSRDGFKEEVLCCLVEACLCNHEASSSWLTVGLEVIDVCFKVLDWPSEANSTICFTYFFLLFEEVCILSKASNLSDRVQQTLENLLNRLTLDTCNLLNQYAFHLALLICSKYWLPQTEGNLKQFMDLIRIRLFSAEHLDLQADISSQCMQFLICCCFQLAKRFSNQSYDVMVRNLEELREVYEERDKENDFISKVLDILKVLALNNDLVENEYQGYFSMLIERIHIRYDEETEIRYDSMHAALNIFRSKRNECFNSERPLELLRMVQPNKELNWRCLPSFEITGICDPLRAFCTHVIYPQYSLVVFCFSFYNNTKFQLRNVQVRFFMSQNLALALKQRNSCLIDEISTNEIFEWKVRAVIMSPGEISGNCLLEFNDPDLPSPCQYKSIVYTVPVPDILLRDISSGNLFSKFILLWVRLNYNITVRCELTHGFAEMIQEITKHMELIPCGQDYRAAFQGATLQGDRIALYVTGSEGSKNARIEYRTNSVDLLKNFTNQTEVTPT